MCLLCGLYNNMNNKKLLRNLYLLARYHANQNRLRANDLIREESAPELHWQDKGLADAYEAIAFYLLKPDLLDRIDYNKIMKANIRVPSWLEDES